MRKAKYVILREEKLPDGLLRYDVAEKGFTNKEAASTRAKALSAGTYFIGAFVEIVRNDSKASEKEELPPPEATKENPATGPDDKIVQPVKEVLPAEAGEWDEIETK